MIEIHHDHKDLSGANLTIFMGYCDFGFARLIVAETEQGICYLTLAKDVQEIQERWPFAALIESNERAEQTRDKILRAWQGDDDICVHLQGTPFQVAVWEELTKIPFGQTASYQDIAEKIGKKEAVRAVGTAVGQNPVPILVPCHRVIRKDGALGEFSLGGPEVKKQLLAAEGIIL